MDEEIQKTALRLPKDLHRKVHEAANDSGRSMNAEIVSRLQESFVSHTPKGTLITAAEARKISEKARARKAAQIRKTVVENINDDFGRGLLASISDFPTIPFHEMSKSELSDLVGDLVNDLETAGYRVSIVLNEIKVTLPE